MQRHLSKIVLLLFFSSTVFSKSLWYPYPVDVWIPPYNINNNRSTFNYSPLPKATQKWDVCVSFPHMKDIYWRSVNFGILQEVKRLGLSMQLFQAGGYEHLDVQIEQIRHCVKDGADGVIIGAISFDGLNDLVTELVSKNLPVIQGRIAIDQLLRILECKPLYKHVGPKIIILDQSNIRTFDKASSFAPYGFKSTYTINRSFH